MAPAQPAISQLLDLTGLIDLIGDDRETLKSLMGEFRASATDLVNCIERGLQNENAEELHRDAHSLKGAANYVGAISLAQCAALLEDAGRNSRF